MMVISFDLDGTLVSEKFSQIVWHKGIPELYARKCGVALNEATQFVFREYEKVGEQSIEWYDIRYWLQFFDLDNDWEKLLGKYKDLIKPYPEVHDVLSTLKQSYKLIITSNAAREFLDTEIMASNLSPYFDRIFSATSDFREVKKTEQFYLTICNLLNVHQSQMIHIGDHFEFDYLVPQRLGITSFYLDRKGEKNGPSIANNLREFMTMI